MRTIRHLSIIVLLSGMVLLANASHSGAQEPLVMVINSYHETHPWVIEHNTALARVLKSRVRLPILYLDTKRLKPEEYAANVDAALALIRKNRPDVVVLTDDNAVKLLGDTIQQLGIPVVFLGVNENPRTYLGNMNLSTGVLERPLYKRSILYINEVMHHHMDRCLLLFEDNTTANVIIKSVFKGWLSSRVGRIDLDIKRISTAAQWREAVLTARNQGYDAVFMGLYHSLKDSAGRHWPSDMVERWTSAESPVPVFGFWEFSIGKEKAVGGLVNSGVVQGEEAGRLVLAVLSGKAPNTLYPVKANSGQFVFSRSGMARWDIVLPDGFNQTQIPIKWVD